MATILPAPRSQLRGSGLQEDASTRRWAASSIIGRCANLTAPLTHNESPQRGTCQARNLCIRGCPFGGYFSERVGHAALGRAHRQHDAQGRPDRLRNHLRQRHKGRATGVRVIDANTGKQTDYFAKIIFMCASAIGVRRTSC